MSDQSNPRDVRPSSLLATARENDRYHWLALSGAALLGLVLATAHWTGLVLGGALVGILAADLKRAVLSGLGFGILVVTVWAALLWVAGSLGAVVSMDVLGVVPVGIALLLTTLGSTLRGALA